MVQQGLCPRTPGVYRIWFLQESDGYVYTNKKKKSGNGQSPLSCGTLYATRVALQHCPVLHISKRKIMVLSTYAIVNGFTWLSCA